VATVDEFGKVTAIAVGSCNVAVKLKNGDIESSCQIVVILPVTSISVDRSSMDMRRNETYSLKVSHLPNNASPLPDYQWSSSDEWVATVSQNGTVEALRIGTTTIRVETSQGLFATCTVTVNPVYNSWREPYLLFGSTQTDVLSAELNATNGRKMNATLSGFAGGQALVFDGEANSRLQHCVYIFTSGKMAAGMLVFPDNNQTSIAAARGYCAERYKFVSESGGITVYEDRRGTHIEAGFRNLTDYVQLTALEKLLMASLGLKDRWFIISYAN